ncbi:MAG TPA: prolyl oligopeptidase family serine peptidase, partial [Allosphingosinicella sp.]
MRRTLLIATAISLASFPAVTAVGAQTSPRQMAVAYPETSRESVVEPQFGVPVADPYRWLENDVRSDPRVREWVTAQNQVTNAFLERLPHRAAFRERMRQVYDFERFSVPEKAGNRYFYNRNDGLQNQSVLFVREGLNGQPRMLIDPNGWSQDQATALAEWEVSPDGRFIAYAIQDGGSDWRTIRVLDVNTGQPLGDEVKWAKFTNIDWAKDNSGFYYSRFPEPASTGQFQSLNENQAVYFHRVGAPQAQDRQVFARPDQPRLNNTAEVSDDGKWLIVTSSEGTDERYDITIIDLTRPDAQPRQLITGRTHDWSYVGNVATNFYWRTNQDAPRQRIVAIDVAEPQVRVREVVGQRDALLGSASMAGDRLFVTHVNAANSEVRVFDFGGREVSRIDLADRIGTTAGFEGGPDDAEVFYSFASYNRPATIYRYDLLNGRSEVFAQPELAFDPANYQVSQVRYRSKDGTSVPMFLVRRRDLPAGPRPTLLYAYGGFNISSQPVFQPRWLTWVDMGGVLAVANIRGGSEFGKEWHDAGRLANKQNVFDDFIGAAEHLIAQGITTNRQLAIEGRSNGGLLVGAVVNQRPDLFAAALPGVGVMDMLRFDRFTAGRYWVDDYGYPNREADFRTLWAYSPYHNIRANVAYPPVLVTTADTDDRVVPGHSFKYISALQHANPRGNPHLIRIETRAGHGSGKPTDKQIEEYSDMYAFAAHFTGLEARPA